MDPISNFRWFESNVRWFERIALLWRYSSNGAPVVLTGKATPRLIPREDLHV